MSGPNAPPMNFRGGNDFNMGPLPSDRANYGNAPPIPAAALPRPGPGGAQPRPSAVPRQAPATPPTTPEQPAQAPAQAPSQVTPSMTPDTFPGGRVPIPQERAAASAADTFRVPSNAAALQRGLEVAAARMQGRQPPPDEGGTSTIPRSVGANATTKADSPEGAIARQIARSQMQGPPAPGQFAYTIKFPGPSEPRFVPKQDYARMYKGSPPPQVSAIPQAMMNKFDVARAKGKLDKYQPPVIPPDSTKRMSTLKQAGDSDQWYYEMLGVQPGDKRGAANAITRLRIKEQTTPWLLTPMEDRLLASAPKSEGFHKSIEPAAVASRRAGYEARRAEQGVDLPEQFKEMGQTQMRPMDPAEQIIQFHLDKMGAPQAQGNRMPTQQDVTQGKQDPTQFQQRFPDFKPQQPSADDYPVTPADETDDEN